MTVPIHLEPSVTHNLSRETILTETLVAYEKHEFDFETKVNTYVGHGASYLCQHFGRGCNYGLSKVNHFDVL